MRTITFYSYKGGVGRTLTLANVAANLSLQGANVVAVDFDLEAPGLHHKLNRDPQNPLPPVQRGLVDLLFDFAEGRPLPESLADYVLPVRERVRSRGWIKLLPAGPAPAPDYWRKLARIDWHELFYAKNPLGVPLFLELKERIAEEYAPDYLLIDSRTGITEMGGVCTTVLPDQVVCLMLKHKEHLEGSRAVLRGIQGASTAEGGLPIEITPVLARCPSALDGAARRRETNRIKAFLNEAAEETSLTLHVSDVLVLRADPLLEREEHVLLGDEVFAGRPLARDYLGLYWRLVPPEQRPARRQELESNVQLRLPLLDLAETTQSIDFALDRDSGLRAHRAEAGRSAPVQLRLIERASATPGRCVVDVVLEGPGAPLAATSTFTLQLTPQDRADLRWYLEDYLLFPLDPAPEIAARIEQRMEAIGEELCRGVFLGNRDATRLWDRAREDLGNTRIEIITDVHHAASVPWELLRDPDSHTPLALEAQAFVRSWQMPTKIAQGAQAIPSGEGAIRILLVICRPDGGNDVPFRSVARKLLKGLDEAAREVFQLDVLRPPTFGELAAALRKAKAEGKPYHVVHFDGHGAYVEGTTKVAQIVAGHSAHVLGSGRAGKRGHLVFESPDESAKERGELVDGPKLGALLVETGVPVLVLNACRSAHADPPEKPEEVGEGDVHSDVESFGSLALEVMDKGVSGVVAMRYNVYVVTAAQLVADLYAALVDGMALGEAVTMGRKGLHARPMREIGFAPVSLQDWCVPVVYEVESLPIFPAPQSKRGVTLSVGKGDNDSHALHGVPPTPDAGFYGRDETLLALDRAFDKHPIVLMRAYAGSGKTSTAAEFARWYSITGGVRGPVLWTSFERHIPLPRVLDVLGSVFEPLLEQNKIPWLALDDDDRRGVALQIMKQIPVLWVWDNVEPIAGFPEGTASAWSEEEQGELVDFLRDARETKAKILLTSRRDEHTWLGELPARVKIPPMPMQERVQLARELASKRGARLDEVADWKPLLAFTQGNPLAITVLVGQALRDGMKSKEQIKGFVDKLKAGEGAFDDDEKEGRSKSLGASLSYGLAAAFGEEDKKRLALLHLFQGFVDVDALTTMGSPKAPWHLSEVRGLSREEGMMLLDRAAEIGLLMAHGGGYYSIHPALPWYFRGLFEEKYPVERRGGDGSDATQAVRAYVEAMGELGDFYHDRYEEGHRDHLSILEAEEPNLLHAWELARRHGWWPGVISVMQGLHVLYHHTGRTAEWARLVDEVTPDFMDPETNGPIGGREQQWGLVNQYRVFLAEAARQWTEAEQLQQAAVTWHREQAAEALALPVEALDAAQRNGIRTFRVSLGALGHIQRELGQANCLDSYAEAAYIAERLGDRVGAATVALNLGHAYKDLPQIRDLDKAEQWYKRSLDMYNNEQRHGRAKCLAQLGLVAHERFKEARDANRPDQERLDYLNMAVRLYHEALDLFPRDAVNDLAVAHNQLGVLYGKAADLSRALAHYQQAIHYDEKAGNLYGAGQTRRNIAIGLANASRLPDARLYAAAALRNFETYGYRAAEDIQRTQQLLADIDRDINSTPS